MEDAGQIEAEGAAETLPEADPSPAERDYAAEARAHGWTEQDAFKGDPAKWVDAETFVRRADEVMPFLKKQNDALKRDISELKQQIKKASAHFEKSEERAYTKAMADLQAQHDQAVEAGDVAAGRKAVKEMTELAADAKAATPEPAIDRTEDGKKIMEWCERTAWYGPDQARTKYADDVLVPTLGQAHEYDGGTEAWLAEIERRVEKKFAEPKPSPVNGSGNRAAPAKGGKSFADLPPEAKAAADKWIKSGLIKSREAYVATYPWDN